MIDAVAELRVAQIRTTGTLIISLVALFVSALVAVLLMTYYAGVTGLGATFYGLPPVAGMTFGSLMVLVNSIFTYYKVRNWQAASIMLVAAEEEKL